MTLLHIMEFSTRSMRFLIQDQTGKRVSESAAVALGKYLEEFAESIAEEATDNMDEQGYTSVKPEDIQEALQSKG